MNKTLFKTVIPTVIITFVVTKACTTLVYMKGREDEENWQRVKNHEHLNKYVKI